MTRGYFCTIKGNNIERVAYLENSAYLSYYGAQILRAIIEGTLDEWITKQVNYNHEVYGKDEPSKDFSLNWIRPDKKTKELSDWDYMDYGYIYDVAKNTLKVYNRGTLLFTVTKKEQDKYLYLFENDSALYHSFAYDEEKLADTLDLVKAMKQAAKCTKEELEDRVASSKERIYLSDDHCIAGGHRPYHEVYQKILKSSDSSKWPLEFIVEHDQLDRGYTDHGWQVLLQTPFLRTIVARGPRTYGHYGSEKAAVKGIRELIKKVGTEKLFRTAEIFEGYRDAKKKSDDEFRTFLDALDAEWEKQPWFATNCCNADAMKREGYHYLYLKEKAAEEAKNSAV